MIYQINELGTVITGHTPSTRNGDFWNSNDIPFVCPADLKFDRYITKTERYVSNKAKSHFKPILLRENSVMISCIGYIGYVGITTHESITNQQINSITNINSNIILPLYLFYLLSSKREYLISIGNNGTTLPIIKKSMFENIEVDVPFIETQQHIVDTI